MPALACIQPVWTWEPALMLPAAQPPAGHDNSLAIRLGRATLRAGLKPVCSLLQRSLPGATKRATRASPTAFNFREPAASSYLLAPSGQTRQHSLEVASHTFSRLSVLHGAQWSSQCIFDALMVKLGHNLRAAPLSRLPVHVCCVSVRPMHAATAHGTQMLLA